MNHEGLQPARISRRSAVVGAIAALAVARSASAGDAPPVDDILADASTRLAAVQSMHFTLSVEGETYIDDAGTILLESAEGDLARPDRVSVEFKVSLFGIGSVSIRMITIGEESWTTDLITGRWGEAPPEFGYNPSVLYDNQDGLGPVMGKLETAGIEGTDDVDDREAWHIAGSAANEVITPLTAGTMTGDPVGIELWIDTETYDLLRVKVIEPESDEKDNPATWELTLTDFDKQVTIEAPA